MRRVYKWDEKRQALVEVHRSRHSGSTGGILRDIEPFVTQDGVEITSRSKLRDYERANGVRQVGTDWTGPEKPAFWDGMVERSNRRRDA